MISVVLLAKNEGGRLERLLPLLSWADKVVVIDDHSSDQTKQVCQKFGVRWVVHALNGDFGAQRNFALSLIHSGWVFFLDADELPDGQLIQAIKTAVEDDADQTIGYQVHRRDFFAGKQLAHGEAGDIWLTRLAYHTAGHWQGKVHETWEMTHLHRLPGGLIHTSHESVSQLFHSVRTYAAIRSQELIESGNSWDVWQQWAYPLGKFINNYFCRLGIFDGWQGLIMAIAMSWHSWLVRWFMWERIPKLGKYLAIMPWILLPLGQLTRVEFGSGAWYGFELFMGLTLLWWVLSRNKFSLIRLTRWWLPLTGLTMAMGISFFISLLNGRPPAAGLYWGRWVLYIAYLGILYEGLASWFKVSFGGIIRFVGMGLLAGGWAQYLFIPDMRWLKLLGWDDHYYRMIGLLFDPNYFGALLLLFGVWILFHEQGKARLVLMGLILGALVATYSRTSLAILALLLVIMMVKNRLWKVGIASIVASVLVWLVLPKPGGEGVNLLRQFSISTRLSTWQQAEHLFLEHPVWGIGYNQYMFEVSHAGQFGVAYHPAAPDNSWLFLLATTGIVGMCCFLWLLFEWFREYHDVTFRLSLLTILIHSLANNTFFYPWVLLWLWLLLLEGAKSKPSVVNGK